uniref:Uncharacterized protein n=1 Tax=Eutreptiella gymnastica TaxID=73025 RepID=A0A7S4CXR7_9EUGL|mmetsp:Transcript_31186/g.52708  ORF Transcript_31186/g.52708 Transcript_31186/m.52708 type:complete len:203 (+) Transcript_31186:1358-1966(+)
MKQDTKHNHKEKQVWDPADDFDTTVHGWESNNGCNEPSHPPGCKAAQCGTVVWCWSNEEEEALQLSGFRFGSRNIAECVFSASLQDEPSIQVAISIHRLKDSVGLALLHQMLNYSGYSASASSKLLWIWQCKLQMCCVYFQIYGSTQAELEGGKVFSGMRWDSLQFVLEVVICLWPIIWDSRIESASGCLGLVYCCNSMCLI